MNMEQLNTKLATGARTCDQCSALRTHSTQDGKETAPGVIEWAGEKNGCVKHPAVATVRLLDGTVKDWAA